MRKYRHSALLVGMLAGAVALAGVSSCSPAGSGTDGSGPGSDKTLVIARTTDLEQLDPATATAFGSTQTLHLLYDTLVRTDSGGKIVPGLAGSWQTGENGRKITFHLRKNVKFHNGDEFTAEAVVATLDRLLDESTGSVVRSNLLSVSDVSAPDPETAVVKLKKADASVLATLTSIGTAVLDPADIKAGRVAKRANGTGGPSNWRPGPRTRRSNSRATSTTSGAGRQWSGPSSGSFPTRRPSSPA